MKESIPAISKEDLNLLPVEIYDGVVEVIDNLEDFERMMLVLNQQTIVGFDTETKPVFAKGKHNKVALLQLATSDACYLIRLNKIGFPDALFRFFANKEILKIGLSLKDDFLMLRGRNGEFEPKGFIELQSFVKAYGISDNSLQKIYAILFGKKLSKAQRLSNWEADILSPGQKIYAALDAVACLHIYMELVNHYQYKILETAL